jgi:CcmD family protein
MMHASMIQPSADDRATEFTAVDGTGEQFNGYTLMVEAYAAIWLILMVWLVFIWRKQANLMARVEGLEAAITRAERKRAGTEKEKTA